MIELTDAFPGLTYVGKDTTVKDVSEYIEKLEARIDKLKAAMREVETIIPANWLDLAKGARAIIAKALKEDI